MKRNVFYLLTTLITSILLLSCTDLSDVNNRLDEHEKRLKNLETLTKDANQTLETLQKLVNAQSQKITLISYSPLDNNQGYKLVMSDGSEIILKNGKNGTTPNIGVTMNDGVLCWTINGELLLDAHGNPIQAEGQDGSDGMTPLLRVNTKGQWEMSQDGGYTWQIVTDPEGNPITAIGEDAEVDFSITENSDGNIVIVFNGQTFIIPRGGSNTDKLTMPEVTNELKEGSYVTLTWTEIKDATHYDIQLDSQQEEKVNDNSIKLGPLSDGTHIFKVRAVGKIDDTIIYSDWYTYSFTTGEEVRVEAYYVGDHYHKGLGNGWINFIKGKLQFNEDGKVIGGNGYILCLDLNVTLASNPDFLELEEGTYNIGEEGAPALSWNAEGASYCISREEGMPSGDISGGTITISKIEDKYHFDVHMETTKGDKIEFTYTGNISFINHSKEGKHSNLKEDKDLTNLLSQGSQTYFGDLFATGKSVQYMLVLSDDDFDLNTNFGLGKSLVIYLNAPKEADSGIPVGDYSGVVDIESDTSAPAWTCIAGYYEYGTYFGCWYFHPRSQIEAKLVDAQVSVQKEGKQYILKGNLKDGYDHNIKFSYKGELRLSKEAK